MRDVANTLRRLRALFADRGIVPGMAIAHWKLSRRLRTGWRRQYADLMLRYYIGSRKVWETQRDSLCAVLERDQPELWHARPRWVHTADYFLCLALLGAMHYDYLNLFLYRHGWRYRQHCVCSAREVMASRVLNDAAAARTCKDKYLAAQQWEAWFGRSSERVSDDRPLSAERLTGLLGPAGKVIVKSLTGYGGKDIEVIEARDDHDVVRAIEHINSLKGPHIVEAYVCQTGPLHDMNPSSLNTVRVITVRLPRGVEVLNAFFRVGCAGSVTDNASSGGLKFLVDRRDGAIGPGSDFRGNSYAHHPDTGLPITGTTIPRWDEVLAFCTSAHEAAPEGLDLVGWDVSVSEDGLRLIEANDCPGWAAPRDGNENQWKLLRGVLDEHECTQKAGR